MELPRLPLDLDDDGLSLDSLQLSAGRFLEAYRGSDDRVVTILFGLRADDGAVAPTAKLTVALA
jgi:hypothetical protein